MSDTPSLDFGPSDAPACEYSHQAAILPCLCGCGRPRLLSRRKGHPPRAYASDACRARVRNRRIAELVALEARFATQPALPGESRVERAFREWISSPPGRYVEREVVRLAREDRAAGDRRGEMNWYLSSVRRTARGLTKDPAGFRCNNSWRSLLARKLMAEHADLAGFFEVRALRGRA